MAINTIGDTQKAPGGETHGAVHVDVAFSYASRLFSNLFFLGLAEAATILLALLLGSFLRVFLFGSHMLSSWMLYLAGAWWVGAIVLRLLPGWGLGAVEELRRLILLLTTLYGITMIGLFLGKAGESASRFVLTVGFIISLILVPLVRTQVKRLLIKINRWGIPVVLYTDKDMVKRVAQALIDESGLGYVPIGFFSDDRDIAFGNLRWFGSLHEHADQIQLAILALPQLPSEKQADLLDGPLSSYRKVVVIPDMQETPTLWVKTRDFVGILGLEISRNLLDPLARIAKWSFDLTIVLLTAPAWVPLGLLIVLLVWLEDRASPFFCQQRIGRGGHLFKTWKFRTMHPEGESILQKALDEDPDLRAEWHANFKLRHDPRITRTGMLLRRTSLDEIPQLFNVLVGEMSLIGPRPLPRYHYDRLPERVRKLRDRVRPGITGLWQVTCRSESGLEGMEKWDAYYVRNWSLWLDIVIFVRTIRAVISGKGAF